MVRTILRIFPDARVSSGYIRIRCPYHKGGKERRPSMSILTEARGSMEAGTCHCFACGKVVQLNELLDKVGANQLPDTAISRQQKPEVKLLSNYLMYKPQLPFRHSEYLERRGIGRDVQERFKIYEKDKMVHMPVFDRDGKYIFVNSRATEGKRYYVEGGAVKTLWGIEEIDLSRPIVVTEGQIDAMTFWEIGMQAVATLGTGNIKALEAIKGSTSLIILAFDGDASGLKAREKAGDLLGRFRCRYVDLPEDEDINDLLIRLEDKNKLLEYVEKNTKSMKIIRT